MGQVMSLDEHQRRSTCPTSIEDLLPSYEDRTNKRFFHQNDKYEFVQNIEYPGMFVKKFVSQVDHVRQPIATRQ